MAEDSLSAAVWFGNVDETGHLEVEGLDESVRESLEKLPLHMLGDVLPDADLLSPVSSSKKDLIKHSNDAVDYGDIDELAEEMKETPKYVPQTTYRQSLEDLMDDEIEESGLNMSVEELMPSFERNAILSFTDFYLMQKAKPTFKKLKIPAALSQFSTENLEVDVNEKSLLPNNDLFEKLKAYRKSKLVELSSVAGANQFANKTSEPISDIYNSIFSAMARLGHAEGVGFSAHDSLDDNTKSRLEKYVTEFVDETFKELDDWENKIIWEDSDRSKLVNPQSLKGLYANSFDIIDASQIPQITALLLSSWRSDVTSVDELIIKTVTKIKNYELEHGDWDERIIWDDSEPPSKMYTAHLVLNKNDPFYVFDDTQPIQDMIRKPHHMGIDYMRNPLMRRERPMVTDASRPMPDPQMDMYKLDRYNLSNDSLYVKNTKGGRVRHTFGFTMVQHSHPAMKLVPGLFKTNFSRSELRNFHRPPLQAAKGLVAVFSKGKEVKDKEFPSHIPKSLKELSIRDDSDFVLLEYSEEYPPIVMNVGMGTLIYNYYKKKGEADDYIPNLDEGDPVVMEKVDASPFFEFGDIKEGQTIQCLYNNLFRAPIFQQKVRSTDFLVIKHSSKRETKYYLRDIPNIFVVGQLFPLMEVPGVHSRKVNLYIKNRVQFTAWRLFKKSETQEKQIKIGKLTSLFRPTADTNIRKWIKEFAEGSRRGKENGVWVLKPNVPIPSDEELKKLVTPEMACLYESMLAGQQRLKDAGYFQLGDDVNEDDEDKLEDEVKLAPWITTRNFVNASQKKAMIQIYGLGDPTGRGEGFSFLRTSMKAMFFREGEAAPITAVQTAGGSNKFNIAEQRLAYKEEIERVWNSQIASLSNTDELDVDKEIQLEPSTSQDAAAEIEDETMSVASYGSRTSGSRQDTRQKILTITRKIKTSDGEKIDSEIITDVRVINAYLRQKQLQQARKQHLIGEIDSPTTEKSGQSAMDVFNPFRSPIEEESGTPTATKKKATVLRCSSCGQVGHNRNNKNCPNYRENIVDDELLIDPERPDVKVEGSRISISKSALKQVSSKLKKPSKRKKIAGDDEMTGFPKMRRRRPLTELANAFEEICNALFNLPTSWAFREPVNPKYAKGYYEMIREPRDLGTMKKEIRDYKYKSVESFLDDIRLLVANCCQYNGETSPLSSNARELLERAQGLVEAQKDFLAELEEEIKTTEERKEVHLRAPKKKVVLSGVEHETIDMSMADGEESDSLMAE